MAVGTIRSLTLNGVDATVTVTDGSAAVGKSLLITGTATANDTKLSIARYVGTTKSLTPFGYALYCFNDLSHGGKIVTGSNGADGDVFCNGKIVLTAPGTIINGDVSAKGIISLAADASVTGTRYQNASSIALPSASGLNYTTAASYTSLFAATSTTGLTFGSEVNGHYQIYNYVSNLSLRGPITGSGVVYVAGDLYVTGDITYATPDSKVSFIVQGQVIFRSDCSSAVGIYYVKDQLISESADLNITRGILAATKITSGVSIRVTRDNTVRDSSSEGAKLCLPGYWP
ncbi:hypothetical protein EON82_16160 [bacterium]|nr:MAG: hypothetical protein EON82_16160 [bacterium]